jgi:hypothetical protein
MAISIYSAHLKNVPTKKTKALTSDDLKKLDNNREVKQNTLPSLELEGQ